MAVLLSIHQCQRGLQDMKLIIAFIKPFCLEEVRDAMESLGIDSFSFAEVRGIGHHKGERDI